jgi:hypothetical protein
VWSTALCLPPPATLSDATAELAVPAILAAAAAGLVLSLPWRRPGLDAWALGAAVTVFAAYAAPVVLSGEPAFGGYIELDDTASWLALTERALEQGANTAGLAPSTYEATLDFYLGSSYPLGAFIPLGAGQLLLGLDAAWLYQPYIALLAAMLALSLYSLARPVIASRPLRALAAFVASQAALLFAYALWGGAKEIAAAWLLALACALVPLTVRRLGGVRAVVPIAVVSAATLAVLSSGGAVWVLPVLALALGAGISPARRTARGGAGRDLRGPAARPVRAAARRARLPGGAGGLDHPPGGAAGEPDRAAQRAPGLRRVADRRVPPSARVPGRDLPCSWP